LKVQKIKNHPLYNEYVKMRKKERKLFREEEKLIKDCIMNEDFMEACRRFVSVRAKLDEVEKRMNEDLEH